jgi:hypothetical protein
METWDEVFLYYDANISYDKFVNKLMYYFERAFPYKMVFIKDRKKTKWITQGIKVSSQKMRLLNNVKKL